MSTWIAEEILATVEAAGVIVSLTLDLNLFVQPPKVLEPLHREMLKNEKTKIVSYLAGRIVRRTQLTVDRAVSLSRIYYAHHFSCKFCIAAGKGYGQRCKEGRTLWFNGQLLAFM